MATATHFFHFPHRKCSCSHREFPRETQGLRRALREVCPRPAVTPSDLARAGGRRREMTLKSPVPVCVVLDGQERRALLVSGRLDFGTSARVCCAWCVKSLEPRRRLPSRSLPLHLKSQKERAVQNVHAHSGSEICSSRRPAPSCLYVSAFVLACPLATRVPSHIHARFPRFTAHSECPRSDQPTRGRRARSSRCRSQSSASGYVAAPRPAPPKLLFLTFSPLPMSRSVVTTCRASSTTTCSASFE